MAGLAVSCRLGLLAACAALALRATSAQAQSGYEVRSWPAHKRSPAIARLDAEEKPVPLSSLKGQALLINCWATWCEPCREEMPSLSQLAQLQSGKLRVVAVNFKQSVATAQRFQDATGLDLPVLYDPEGALARAWGIRVFPSTVLIDAKGRVHSVVRGALDWNSAAATQLVAPLLPGGPGLAKQPKAP